MKVMKKVDISRTWKQNVMICRILIVGVDSLIAGAESLIVSAESSNVSAKLVLNH